MIVRPWMILVSPMNDLSQKMSTLVILRLRMNLLRPRRIVSTSGNSGITVLQIIIDETIDHIVEKMVEARFGVEKIFLAADGAVDVGILKNPLDILDVFGGDVGGGDLVG